jgi:hypothetical protein
MAATFGAPKKVRSGSSTPNACRTLDTAWVARSEWPPSAKKSSSTPIRSLPSNSFQISSSRSSTALRGATSDCALSSRAPSGAGSRRRSTLPFWVIGKASSSTKAEGIM